MSKHDSENSSVTGDMPSVKPSCMIWLSGIFSSIFALIPLIVLADKSIFQLTKPLNLIIPALWAVIVGYLFTLWWSWSLHKRIEEISVETKHNDTLKNDETFPIRIPWMPAFVGVFERLFYVAVIGFDVSSAGAFIIGWLVLKSAGGWQLWNKGSSYGRAIFLTGLLGNAMSILFGVTAGIVVREIGF